MARLQDMGTAISEGVSVSEDQHEDEINRRLRDHLPL